MITMTSIEIRAEQLRSEIAQLEARYDGAFPPGVYAVLKRLRQKPAAMSALGHQRAQNKHAKLASRALVFFRLSGLHSLCWQSGVRNRHDCALRAGDSFNLGIKLMR